MVRLSLLAIPSLTFIFLAANLKNLPAVATSLFAGEYPRSVATLRALSEIPEQYHFAPWVGLGPGQFCSRAALIGTGRYFGGPDAQPLPLIGGAIPKPMDDHLIDLWEWTSRESFGTTQEPFYSWLSVYTEFGAVAALAVLAIAISLIRKVRAGSATPEVKLLAMSFTAGVLFLLLLGCQENYWEVPQAIFPGCFFLKCLHANLTVEGQFPSVVRSSGTL